MNIRTEPSSVGAELVPVQRGGDVTYHGPGQLVGYPIVNVENSLGASGHVCDIQRLVVGALRELGLDDVGCLDEYPGVWVGVEAGTPRKISAIGVRLSRGRTMHGFALNVHPDMAYMREHKLKFSTLNRVVVGGSACPPAMLREFRDSYGVRCIHAWGMTEMSPLGTTCTLQIGRAHV